MRYLAVIPAMFLLVGCATSPSMYEWGKYDQALYNSYKDATQIIVLQLKLETHISELEKSGKKVAPGLYAELGTLYLQAGSSDKAVVLYGKERDAWPESKQLMTAMIDNLERRKQAKGEAAK